MVVSSRDKLFLCASLWSFKALLMSFPFILACGFMPFIKPWYSMDAYSDNTQYSFDIGLNSVITGSIPVISHQTNIHNCTAQEYALPGWVTTSFILHTFSTVCLCLWCTTSVCGVMPLWHLLQHLHRKKQKPPKFTRMVWIFSEHLLQILWFFFAFDATIIFLRKSDGHPLDIKAPSKVHFKYTTGWGLICATLNIGISLVVLIGCILPTLLCIQRYCRNCKVEPYSTPAMEEQIYMQNMDSIVQSGQNNWRMSDVVVTGSTTLSSLDAQTLPTYQQAVNKNYTVYS